MKNLLIILFFLTSIQVFSQVNPNMKTDLEVGQQSNVIAPELLSKIELTSINIRQAKALFEVLKFIVFEDDPNKTDFVAFENLKSGIKSYRNLNLKPSNWVISITFSGDFIKRFYSLNKLTIDREDLVRSLKIYDEMANIFEKINAVEKANNVAKVNSVFSQ